MSRILPKARHPMAFDVLNDALLKVFVSGPGATLVQIAGDDGARVFRPTSGDAPAVREWETDDAVRLHDAFRWPWGPAQGVDTAELFFIVRSGADDAPLTFTVRGSRYTMVVAMAGDLIWVESESDAVATDVLRFSRTDLAASLELATLGDARAVSVRRYRSGGDPGDWHLVDVAHLVVTQDITLVHGDLASSGT